MRIEGNKGFDKGFRLLRFWGFLYENREIEGSDKKF
jgi:hypothetical protein